MMFDREYYFYGKHADMVRKLTTNWNDKIGASVFERNLDVYEIAPIIGWIYNRKAEVEIKCWTTGRNYCLITVI